MFKTVSAKFGKMRKAQDFIARPRSDGKVQIQSDKSIGYFVPATGEGILCMHGRTYAPIDWSVTAIAFSFPADFVNAIMAICPTPGGVTVIGGGAMTVINTITVL